MLQTSQRKSLLENGFAFLAGPEFPIPDMLGPHVKSLSQEWDSLEPDKYLRNRASFRERRYGRHAYHPQSGKIRLLKHHPYFQSAETNRYAGGIARVVAPISASFISNPLLGNLIRFDFGCFPIEDAWRDDWWLVACHLFRIIGRPDEFGEPTPEGVHRDDIDFGAIHLVKRENAIGGLSLIHNEDRSVRAEMCLQIPLDTLFWADRQVLHSVTPIAPKDEKKPAIRDILILGYTRTPDLPRQEWAYPQ